jgi:hypothetical protein
MRQCICDCPGHHLSEARHGAEGTRDEGCSRQGAHFWVSWVGELRRLLRWTWDRARTAAHGARRT